MTHLKIYNSQVLEQIDKISFAKPTSSPLLVSSNEQYVSLIKAAEDSILYIGQETNTWLYQGANQEEIENMYYKFLTIHNGTNRPFWKFIKEIIGDGADVGRRIIWANALLVGNVDKKGAIEDTDQILEISISYLEFLYHYFKPEKVIIVCGARNPYYQVIHEFLNRIGFSDMQYPTIKQPLIHDDTNHIFWSYHPRQLNMQHKFKEISTFIQSNLSKKR